MLDEKNKSLQLHSTIVPPYFLGKFVISLASVTYSKGDVSLLLDPSNCLSIHLHLQICVDTIGSVWNCAVDVILLAEVSDLALVKSTSSREILGVISCRCMIPVYQLR